MTLAGTIPLGATVASEVRHRVLLAQLAAHLPAAPARVLDVGAGVGRLASTFVAHGHHVTAWDASPAMVTLLGRLRDGLAPEDARRLEVVRATVEERAPTTADGIFDLVCCHAVLPTVSDHRGVLTDLARLVAPGGALSVVAKNADALAMRAGLEGRFAIARDLARGGREHDEDGRVLAAHDPADVIDSIAGAGLSVIGWHGVGVVTAHRHDPVVPDEVAAAVDLEQVLGSRDPTRRVARQFHVIATRA